MNRLLMRIYFDIDDLDSSKYAAQLDNSDNVNHRIDGLQQKAYCFAFGSAETRFV